ncbi:MAG: 2-oxoglutarate dehydrogenase, E2 component, dihydrolipoamide succinyltransferase [Ignavibacteriae bacterium]|nr:2-oxoglutarate dehydrogenase, E2 component, dihydrolipoamide succinyltransferase [Ignavibacteriota bacterium]
MKTEVVMPKMGESLQEGTVLKWLKNVGDKIERDEMLLEISTDKVDTEVPSPVSGIVVEILAVENETVEVGKVIAFIETEQKQAMEIKTKSPVQPIKKDEIASVPSNETTKNEVSADAGEIVEVVMPKMGESLQEGTVIKWLKNIGDKIERDEMLLEISTDKVDTEVPSPVAGIIVELLAKENETVEVGKVIAKISSGKVISTSKVTQTTSVKAEVKTQPQMVSATEKSQDIKVAEVKEIPRTSGKRFYSPLVRTIAETESVLLNELESIAGTGAEGRVTKKDILTYIENRKAKQGGSVPTKGIVQHTFEQISVSVGSEDVVIPMDRVRQRIAEHMVYSKHASPHVTSVGEADVTEIVKYRKSHLNEFQNKEGFKLTYTPFFADATIKGLKEFPMVNVSVDGKNIIKHNRINLGIATALPDGNLIVPVLRNADSLSILGLSQGIYDLSSRARTKKLNPDDIQGGTITITNVGTFGTLFGTPIINQPQTAIIGIGAVQKRPVVREIEGEPVIAIRDMAYISITYDHRVIDGMLAGQCLAAIIRTLESMNENTIVM